MVSMWHVTLLLLATTVLADYYIDNANTSIVYSMAPKQSGQAWQTFSTGTQSLGLSFSNSTGNYTIPLDASYCYDENYARKPSPYLSDAELDIFLPVGVCGANDNCFVQLPFTGSGITMYVFNAGLSGMTASFSVDDGTAVSETIQAPPPSTYQVSNVSLYNIQGLTSGNHTMKMTILDWNGSPTSMKFDYAYVNESFVAPPATTTATSSTIATSTFQTTSQTSSSPSKKVNLGAVIGGTLGGVTIIASVVIGFFLRRRKARRQEEITSGPTFGANPFGSQYPSIPPPHVRYASQGSLFAQHGEASPSVPPLQRSAMLRDALADSNYSYEPIQRSRSISSGVGSPILEPVHLQTSQNTDADLYESHVVDAGSPFSDTQITSSHSLTAEQLEVIDRLRVNRVPAETIQRVIEGFAPSRVPAGGELTGSRSISSAMPPPSYRTLPS